MFIRAQERSTKSRKSRARIIYLCGLISPPPTHWPRRSTTNQLTPIESRMSASARTVVRLCGTGGSGSEHAQQQEERRINSPSLSYVISLHHQLLTASAQPRHRSRMQCNAGVRKTAQLHFRIHLLIAQMGPAGLSRSGFTRCPRFEALTVKRFARVIAPGRTCSRSGSDAA
jgi:hypothetical protein